MRTKQFAFGFFKETVPQLKRKLESIHSAEFRDHEHPQKTEIMYYLDMGKVDALLFGSDPYDTFKDPPEKLRDNVQFLTDGRWIWPETASYFVNYYNLSLPEDFIDNMAQNEWRVPDEIYSDLQKKVHSCRYPDGSKHDWLNQALQISTGEIALPADDIPGLLGWLQDRNWPAVEEISEFLRTHTSILIEPVRSILTGGDDIWKANVLDYLVSRWEVDQQRQLVPEMLKLARQPDPEAVHLAALEVCVASRLVPEEVLLDIIATNQLADPEKEREYQRLRGMLDTER